MIDRRAKKSRHIRIGVDIGGTKSHAVAIDRNGMLVHELLEPSGSGPDGLLDGLVRSVRIMAEMSGVSTDEIHSIGVGIPGQVDIDSGVVRQAVNLGVQEWQLADDLYAAIGIRPTIDNDVNAAALGAQKVLGIDGSMAYLNLGTGVAAGIVVDGELLHGTRGAAGEIGHVSIDANGPLCDCGQRGCIEAFSGGRALGRLMGGAARPLARILDDADSGDNAAAQARRDFSWSVAAAVRILVLSVDPQTIVIGGGAVALGERISEPILSAIEEAERGSAFLRSLDIAKRVRFLPATLRAPAIGAALLKGTVK